MTVLFLCVGNSARSQIAEGLARTILPPGTVVLSAGSQPAGVVHELARRVLAEVGIDASRQTSKHVSTIDLDAVDLAVALCAEEECPVLPARVRRLDWSLPDPGYAPVPERLDAFRAVRDEIARRLQGLRTPP